MTLRPVPLRPERLRHLEKPFGWMPFRLLTGGRLATLSVPAKALYLVLCLVADRQGLSYWSDPRLQPQVGLDAVGLRQARDELQSADLLDFDGRVYQLLSLPEEKSASLQTARPRRHTSETPEHISAVLAPLLEKLKDV